MGASQSRAETDEKVFQIETPISFSPDVVNRLSDDLESPQTTPERQSILDAHIRARIHGELDRLRNEEETVREEIERALEKENLDREKSMVPTSGTDGSSAGHTKNSAALLGDLEEVRSKIDKYHQRKDLNEFQDVQANGANIVECYKKHSNTPLDCWHEVNKFKASVTTLEQYYIKSL